MKREQGIDSNWINQRARVLVPLVDRLNHIGEFVRGLENYADNVDVSDMLSRMNDLLSTTMSKVSKREELPFTESTFRNFLNRFPAFEHRVSTTDSNKEADETVAETAKLMSWLQIQ